MLKIKYQSFKAFLLDLVEKLCQRHSWQEETETQFTVLQENISVPFYLTGENCGHEYLAQKVSHFIVVHCFKCFWRKRC